jgi:hypothetical protein
MDLLSLDEDATVTAPSVGISREEQDSVRSWFNAATLAGPNQKVVLYQNATLSVSVSSEYRAHQGRLQLFIYNKSNFDFTRFEVNCRSESSDELSVRTQGCPVLVTAGDEARIMVAVEAFQPFTKSPSLDISFSLSGVSYKYGLQLPVAVNSFFEAIPSDKNTYMQRWKMLEGEVQEVFTAGHALTSDYLGQMKASLVPGLRIGLAQELDTSEKTLTGSISFKTGTVVAGSSDGMSLQFNTIPGQFYYRCYYISGALVSVGGMFRLEADPAQNRYRVTIRAKNPTLAVAIKELFKSHLA